MYGCCARSRCSPSHPIIATTPSLLYYVPLVSLSFSLPHRLSFVSVSVSSFLSLLFSITSRINDKSGLLNDWDTGHAHCSLVVAHATSAFDLLPVLFVSSSVDSSIRCSSVQRDDFLLWWRSREMEIRERIQFLSEIKFFKVQDWNWADFCFRNRSGSFFFLIIRRENCKYLAVFAAFFNDSTLIEYREK